MEIQQLEYYLELCRQENFTEAGFACNLSQSALSLRQKQVSGRAAHKIDDGQGNNGGNNAQQAAQQPVAWDKKADDAEDNVNNTEHKCRTVSPIVHPGPVKPHQN